MVQKKVSNEQNDEECDARKMNGVTAAGNNIIKESWQSGIALAC